MQCHELKDVKYIENHHLTSLKASVMDAVLTSEILENLTNLKHLDLSDGDLKNIAPGTFRTLVNLKSLDLANNRLEYLDLSSLEGLHELRSLNLRRNNMVQLPPVLLRLKNLKHLDVHGNPLECNCATLRVRDLLAKRGVKLSKKVTCAGPNGSKGTSLLKLEIHKICAEEQADKEMLGDQPYEGSGETERTNDEDEMFPEIPEESFASHEEEVETPAPEIQQASSVVPPTTAYPQSGSEIESSIDSTVSTEASLGKTSKESEELFFDTDEQKATTEMTKKKVVKDSLFYPVEGSGDEGSGTEGSGFGLFEWSRGDEETDMKEDVGIATSSTTGGDFLSILFHALWTSTVSPEEKKEPSLEEEEFIDASATKTHHELGEVPVTKSMTEATTATAAFTTETVGRELSEVPVTKSMTEGTTAFTTSTVGSELVDIGEAKDMSKLGTANAEIASMNEELAEVSPARQSKKGMGSYVVLAALLAILAVLIGFAAYKGDFCRKKRKRGDVENGTELKDMQKSLLDTGNMAQPKIASNGNPENVPLVGGTIEQEDVKDTAGSQERPRTQNGISDQIDQADPVKPPRKALSTHEEPKTVQENHQDSVSSKDDSFSARTSPVESAGTTSPRLQEANGPPLSPNAQRVKITLQENPDSVPKTPVLITRTTAGDNLVKTP